MRNPQFEEAAVKDVQRYLRHLSFFDGDIPPLPLSGVWDPHTQDALLAFQRKNGLPPTGAADATTWNLLFDQYTRSMREKAPPLPMPVYPRLPERDSLRQGDVGFPVTAVQYMLDQLSIQFDGLNDVPQNGLYDEKTAEAVKEFQRRHLIPVTGEVDKQTWDTLVGSYEAVTQDQMQ